MIDISRGLKQVSLLVDFAQTAGENWKLLQFTIFRFHSITIIKVRKKYYKYVQIKQRNVNGIW